MAKIIVSIDHPVPPHNVAAAVKTVADALGVLEADVVLVPHGMTVSIVEVPTGLLMARAAHDKAEEEARKEAEAPADDATADYEGWTAKRLHAEASARGIHGSSGMDKAALVAALKEADCA